MFSVVRQVADGDSRRWQARLAILRCGLGVESSLPGTVI